MIATPSSPTFTAANTSFSAKARAPSAASALHRELPQPHLSAQSYHSRNIWAPQRDNPSLHCNFRPANSHQHFQHQNRTQSQHQHQTLQTPAHQQRLPRSVSNHRDNAAFKPSRAPFFTGSTIGGVGFTQSTPHWQQQQQFPPSSKCQSSSPGPGSAQNPYSVSKSDHFDSNRGNSTFSFGTNVMPGSQGGPLTTFAAADPIYTTSQPFGNFSCNPLMPSSGPHTGQRSLGGGATATASNAMVVLGPVGAVYESASAATKALPEESISSRSASSTPVGKQLAETIIFLLSTRDEGLSICPSEVAHKMATTPSATAALRPSPFSSRIPSRSGSSGGASIPATFNSHDDLREDQLEVPPGTALLASGVAIAPVQNAGIAWRDLLPQIRTCAIELAKSGVICVTQGHSDRWHEVDLSNEQVLGPIRLRRGPNFEPVPAE